MTLNFRSYLLCVSLVIATVVGAMWLYTSLMPMRFLEGGYPIWVAKQDFIHDCDLGSPIVLGDSRPESAIIPALLNPRAVNLSSGAATPIENYFFAKRALSCPHPPQIIIYSHSISSFVHTNEFLWTNATRYGFITFGDLREIAHSAAELHDRAFFATNTHDGLTGIVRDLAYSSGFPSIFTASLVKARGFERYSANETLFQKTAATRGAVIYPDNPNGNPVGLDAELKTFAPLPIQTFYFDKTLKMLAAAGVTVLFVPIPVSNSTVAAMDPKIIADFAQYVTVHTADFPNVLVARPVMARWPDDLFVDGSHLNERGATIFSNRLSLCLSDGPAKPCDLTWH